MTVKLKNNMPQTPQNLPALIKEMQDRARERFLTDNHTSYDAEKLNTAITDTANATLEYVKGVTGELQMGDFDVHPKIQGFTNVGNYNQALKDLIARLTSNPQ
jgi:hypothetical protein